MRFPVYCRELRVKAALRQREVAKAIGLKPATYGNLESNSYRTVREDRARKLADFHKLSESTLPTHKDFMAAWAELPRSSYSVKREKVFEKIAGDRRKVRAHDAMRNSLIDLAGLLMLTSSEPGKLCACQLGDLFEPDVICELCAALKLLGIDPDWTKPDAVVSSLAALTPEKTEAP